MSAPVFPDDVAFLQRMLCSAGCYAGPTDGVWSSAVDEADMKFEIIAHRVASTNGVFDARSERNIRTLHPAAQAGARRLLSALRKAGIDARIISGTRSYAEQAALYRIGRFGDTRTVVTNAQEGHSNHNFGIAWDIGIFEHGNYVTHEAPYRDAAVFSPAGVEWGGHWKTFPDMPHYQLAIKKPLQEIRQAFEQGTPFVVV